MRIIDYPLRLQMLSNAYIQKYLEGGSRNILNERAVNLRSSLRNNRNWRFYIPITSPLTFKKNSHGLQIDFACELEGNGENITKQSIILRIWSYEKDITFRENIDSLKLKSRLKNNSWKRVILRFHFDRSEPNSKQIEPFYHLHVGGRCRTGDENCWLHEDIDIPRFPYHPMDIILLSEFILINFFPEDSEKLRKTPEWKGLVRDCQELFITPYYGDCAKHLVNITEKETLLGKLVTFPRDI